MNLRGVPIGQGCIMTSGVFQGIPGSFWRIPGGFQGVSGRFRGSKGRSRGFPGRFRCSQVYFMYVVTGDPRCVSGCLYGISSSPKDFQESSKAFQWRFSGPEMVSGRFREFSGTALELSLAP